MDDQGNRYVGVQMLARGGAAVTVAPASPNGKNKVPPTDGELCVLLPSGSVQSAEATLLMPDKLFSGSRSLIMRAYDRQYVLFPLGLVENSEEFQIARYRIMDQFA